MLFLRTRNLMCFEVNKCQIFKANINYQENTAVAAIEFNLIVIQ